MIGKAKKKGKKRKDSKSSSSESSSDSSSDKKNGPAIDLENGQINLSEKAKVCPQRKLTEMDNWALMMMERAQRRRGTQEATAPVAQVVSKERAPKPERAARKHRSWIQINPSSLGSSVDRENINMLRRSDVPKLIYIREENDVVKQLCSIGAKTYGSSHRVPFGDAAKVKTLTEKEYLALWERLKDENMDKSAYCNIRASELLTQKAVKIESEQSVIESGRFYGEKELLKRQSMPLY